MKLITTGLCAVAALLAASPAMAADMTGLGSSIYVASDGDVTLTYVDGDAAYVDELFLAGRPGPIFTNSTTPHGTMVDLGNYTAGTELLFSIFVTNTGNTFYSGPANRNSDGVFHATATGDNLVFVAFEDKLNGGDRDYNDFTFQVSNANTGAVPEPASWAMMISGFGLVGGAMRARRRSVSFA